jgi:isoleucyl-tRNA synthetase
MTIVMAPILPHLAEEIYHVASGQERAEEGLSVFVQGWRSVVCRFGVFIVGCC